MTCACRTTILVAALGGQGGGVLTDWIVEAARAEGYVAQATSTPGVSQRTGSTTYYVEIAGREAPDGPVLGLAPMAGRVDVLVCAELLEAARMLERGFCTPARTTVVASTHRVYTTREKMSAGDARFASERVVSALRALSSRAVLFDMEALRQRHGAVISAALFGALAGSGAVPMSRKACEDAIAASGKGVAASLAAFAEAYAHARKGAHAPSPQPSPASGRGSREGSRYSVRPEAASGRGRVDGGEAAAQAGPASTQEPALPSALAARLRALPPRVAELARHGVGELLEFQDAAYAATYVERVERVAAADVPPHETAREAARHLALWMRYDDLIRVASRKARRARFAGIRDEAGAKPGDVVRVYDFFKPGALEVAAILPRPLGAWLEARALARATRVQPPRGRHGGLTLQASSIGGVLALRALAALRPLRPRSLRFAREQQAIGAWLDSVVGALAAGERDAARDLATLPRLIRGYGDTHAGGRASFERLLAAWREASPRDAHAAAQALREGADAAFSGADCSPSPRASAAAARSAAASSRA